MLKKNSTVLLFVTILIVTLMVACKSKTKSYTASEKQNFEENLIKANRGLLARDRDDIIKYIAKNDWKMQQTETGLWYEILTFNSGTKAIPGMIAHIKYDVSLLDGTLCYSSDSLGLKTFKIGQGGVESGLEESILMLSEGDLARFIMPPYLAYGLVGDENKIPPRSTIVYNVELIKLTDY